MTTKETKRKVVQLDVGGTLYKVAHSTLERCKGSMLASLVSDHWKEGNADSNEPIFIDRNGLLFQYVLDYLRTRKILVPPSVSRAAVKEEFQYYGIDADMSKVIEKYGREYRCELKMKISAKRTEMIALKTQRTTLDTQFAALKTDLITLENEARAIQASAFFEQVSLRTRLPAKVCMPREYVPFDVDTLQKCSQLHGLNVSRLNGAGYTHEYVFNIQATDSDQQD